MKNQIKTVLLLTGLSALFLAIGHMLGGQSGMMTALLFSLVMNFGAYWYSDKLVLAMHKAREIGPEHDSGVYELTQELCREAGLPMPRVYLTPDWMPNAFATGRDPKHAAVAVTQGILEILTPRELRGVLAHEISHIKNRDILVSTLVAAVASAIMYLAHMLQWMGLMGGLRRDDGRGGGVHPLAMLVTVLLAPLAAALVQAAVSRTREFMADETGAHLSGDPEALASALQKISDPRLIENLRGSIPSDVQPAFSHLYIMSPLAGQSMLNLFSTHPPVRERVKKLMAFAGKAL